MDRNWEAEHIAVYGEALAIDEIDAWGKVEDVANALEAAMANTDFVEVSQSYWRALCRSAAVELRRSLKAANAA